MYVHLMCVRMLMKARDSNLTLLCANAVNNHAEALNTLGTLAYLPSNLGNESRTLHRSWLPSFSKDLQNWKLWFSSFPNLRSYGIYFFLALTHSSNGMVSHLWPASAWYVSTVKCVTFPALFPWPCLCWILFGHCTFLVLGVILIDFHASLIWWSWKDELICNIECLLNDLMHGKYP